ncbi:hypothetical protein TanjilG_21125 [Lupinus angustifolius]|uniref:BHLH domain-containing protein n=1 Tax=Lupinus angustifolius TaxID=3871 RepID=A0A1J7IPT1_LUPAN|nr:PREDICTED: transcription factor bHLH68-like [Lupinus angustifolius]XP_019424963.1 PREDICTED: transcription factor bHLH68-like [Lupinus angustifolius]OIW17148.1 hypothetical protein TanjilG_21125 [Lupinus angustifolius]
MMAENPNWWNMNPPSLSPPQYLLESSSIPFNSLTENPEPPQPWSQLLFTELPREEERVGFSHFQSKKFENWDDHILNPSTRDLNVDLVKQEGYQSVNVYEHANNEEFHQAFGAGLHWSHIVQASNNSPSSNLTSLSSTNLLDFTYNNADHTSECISTATAIACKKAKGQPSSSQPKVRKEKLGDRVTALHQIVSPFGKTDTASVLLEAIGYIRFLQGQIEALSSPYLGNVSKNIRNQHSVMSDIGLKRKGAPNQDTKDNPKDLRSRGLCLVPVSCTQHVGSENGADCWSSPYGSGF